MNKSFFLQASSRCSLPRPGPSTSTASTCPASSSRRRPSSRGTDSLTRFEILPLASILARNVVSCRLEMLFSNGSNDQSSSYLIDCSSSLPLASTRWVRSTFLSLPRCCSSVGRASESSQAGVTLLYVTWVRFPAPRHRSYE